MKPTPEYLDREKTFEVALADDDAGAGSAIVKMAPVETRDPYGDMLMSGAFDAAKGKAIPGSRGAQHVHAAARQGGVHRREEWEVHGDDGVQRDERLPKIGGRPPRPASCKRR